VVLAYIGAQALILDRAAYQMQGMLGGLKSAEPAVVLTPPYFPAGCRNFATNTNLQGPIPGEWGSLTSLTQM
jgi:hypothetical protein